ncbi:hypothetical protein HDU76_005989 [Blyttiomyces sp. JEL0837]|nr:hypothetical protein HDU76_005989 [Blyttiomyces sp. JEL0837]
MGSQVHPSSDDQTSSKSEEDGIRSTATEAEEHPAIVNICASAAMSMDPLPSYRLKHNKLAMSKFGKAILAGQSEILAAVMTRHPISPWTLMFKDKALENDYTLKMSYRSIPGNIVTTASCMILEAIMIAFRWHCIDLVSV